MSEIKTSEIRLLRKAVLKNKSAVFRICKELKIGDLRKIGNEIKKLEEGFSDRFLPFHYVEDDGRIIPLTVVEIYKQKESLPDTERLIGCVRSCEKQVELYYADSAMIYLFLKYLKFLYICDYGKSGEREKLIKAVDELSFPFSKSASEIVDSTGNSSLFYEDKEFCSLTGKSKADIRIMSSRLCHAAEISEKRALQGLLSDRSGMGLPALVHRDYYTVFPVPKVGKIRGYTALLSLLPVALSAFCFGVWWLLLYIPIVALARQVTDTVLSRIYSAVYFPPPCVNTDGKIPENGKTLAVISALVTSPAVISELIKKADRILCKNPSENLFVSLLCDLPPARTKNTERDNAVYLECEKAAGKIRKEISIILRPRKYNFSQKVFMGYERKRGAVSELAAYFYGEGGKCDFKFYGKKPEKPKYFLLLDYDTEVGYSGVSRLVGYALANPVRVSKSGEISGYGIFAPECVSDLYSAEKSRFTLKYFGRGGIKYDSYGAPDFYMSIYGRGLFCGKGLIDAEYFYESCGKLPENRVLSHDILEGGILRCAAVPVVFSEGCPESSAQFFARQNRWNRGDIQNIIFLFSKKYDISDFEKYCMENNLLRILSPVFLFSALIFGNAVAGYFSAGIFLLSLILKRERFVKILLEASVFSVVVLNSVLSTTVTIFRMIRRKNLLCWSTFLQTSGGGLTKTAVWFAAAFPLSLWLLIKGAGSPAAFVAGVLDTAALPLFLVLDKPLKNIRDRYTVYEKRDYLSQSRLKLSDSIYREQVDILKREFMFLYEFTNRENNYLPPDNVQLKPAMRVDSRTSPTNIGMYLLSLVCADILGIITEKELYRRFSDTLTVIEGLEKYKGHLYNWYDTKKVKRLSGFVSSVDSGNFLACCLVSSEAVKHKFPDIAKRLEKINEGADLSVFLNHESKLLSVGFDTDKSEISPHCYDLLMSEALLTYFYTVAKGQIPISSFEALSKISGRVNGKTGCLSWSGTCFEYFLPQLFLYSPYGGLLYESLEYSLYCQKRAYQKGLFGISESGYPAFNDNLSYRYFAFGAPCNALRPDYFYSAVYSPYSVFLMNEWDFEMYNNALCEFKNIGGYNNTYGFYEAVMITDKGAQTVYSFMSHHKGFSIAALTNRLTGGKLRQLFFNNPQMSLARELLTLPENLKGEIIKMKFRKPLIKAPINLNEEKNSAGAVINGGELTLFAVPYVKGVHASAINFNINGENKLLFYPFAYGQYDRFYPYKSFNVYFKSGEDFCEITDGEITEKAGGIDINSRLKAVKVCGKIRLCDGGFKLTLYLENTSDFKINGDILLYLRPALGDAEQVTVHPAFSDLFLKATADSKFITVTRRHRGSDQADNLSIICDTENYSYCFNRESEYVKKLLPLTKNDGCHVPSPCVYLTFPIGLCAKGERVINIGFGVDGKEEASREKAESALIGIVKNSDKVPYSAEKIIACNILPHIVFNYPATKCKISNLKSKGDILYKYNIGNAPVLLFKAIYDDDNGVTEILRAAGILKSAGLKFTAVFLFTEIPKTAESEYIRQQLDAVGAVFLRCGDLTEEQTALLNFKSVYTADVTSPIIKDKPTDLPNIYTLPKPCGENKFTNEGYKIAGETPLPWCIVTASPQFGFLLQNDSLGFVFAKNSRLNKCSTWNNDTVTHSDGIGLYLKEEEKITDIIKNSVCTYKRYTADYKADVGDISLKTEVAVPYKGCMGVIRVTAENKGDADKNISLILAVRTPEPSFVFLKDGCLAAFQPDNICFDGFFSLKAAGGRVAYGNDKYKMSGAEKTELISGRADFLCAKVSLSLPASQKLSAVFVLSFNGKTADLSSQSRLILSGDKAKLRALFLPPYSAPKYVTENIKTDNLLNIFLPQQILNCRLYAKSGFYQCGGAYGFRDQLQDAMAVDFYPEILKRQIYRSCAAQFIKGDVLHWFHVTDKGVMGVRTGCSDDMLWLALAAAEYYLKTRDISIFEKEIACCKFQNDAEPSLGEDIYDRVIRGEKISVKQHVLNATFYHYNNNKFGAHGLCLIGSGDWNDSYNTVGSKGKGESVWLSCFLCLVLDKLCLLPDSVISPEEKLLMNIRSEKMRENINTHAYRDGYYIRAFYDDGEIMGGGIGDNSVGSPCKIDLLPQAFSVLANINRGESISRSISAMNIALANLVDYDGGLIKLFTPAFSPQAENKAGYVGDYPIGVRENGGQYTHAALWFILALIKLGEKQKARELLELILPCNKIPDIYKAEPYYFAADVYSNPTCYGRAGWSGYTGSAGWGYRVMRLVYGDR